MKKKRPKLKITSNQENFQDIGTRFLVPQELLKNQSERTTKSYYNQFKTYTLSMKKELTTSQFTSTSQRMKLSATNNSPRNSLLKRMPQSELMEQKLNGKLET